MHTAVVFIHVKHERGDEFLAATLENVRASLMEPGVKRFDLLREKEDPDRFLLIEVYGESADQARHKETAHYRRWATVAEPLLAEPRRRTICEGPLPTLGLG